MSLCPDYCECPVCNHHRKVCEDCSECEEKHERKLHQIAHEESVKRQRSRLKLMDRGDK